jgi:predicted transcriptional regulator
MRNRVEVRLAKREKIRKQKTLEGLADVDAGRVAAHERVRAWAKGLERAKMKKA